jgi:hypothetical protein
MHIYVERLKLFFDLKCIRYVFTINIYHKYIMLIPDFNLIVILKGHL